MIGTQLVRSHRQGSTTTPSLPRIQPAFARLVSAIVPSKSMASRMQLLPLEPAIRHGAARASLLSCRRARHRVDPCGVSCGEWTSGESRPRNGENGATVARPSHPGGRRSGPSDRASGRHHHRGGPRCLLDPGGSPGEKQAVHAAQHADQSALDEGKMGRRSSSLSAPTAFMMPISRASARGRSSACRVPRCPEAETSKATAATHVMLRRRSGGR